MGSGVGKFIDNFKLFLSFVDLVDFVDMYHVTYILPWVIVYQMVDLLTQAQKDGRSDLPEVS